MTLVEIGTHAEDHVSLATIAEVDTIDDTIDLLSDDTCLKKHQGL